MHGCTTCFFLCEVQTLAFSGIIKWKMPGELGVAMKDDVTVTDSASFSDSSTTACGWLSGGSRETMTPSPASTFRGHVLSGDETTLYWESAEAAGESFNSDEYKTPRVTVEGSPSQRMPQPRSKVFSTVFLFFAAAVLLTVCVGSWRLTRKSEPPIPEAPQVEEIPTKRKPPRARPKLTIPPVLHIRGPLSAEPETPTVLRPWGAVQMPVDSGSLQAYENDVNTAFAQLEKVWEHTPEASRKAFVTHHLPSVDGLFSPPAPFAIFQRHAEAMRAIQRPAETASTNEKNVYATRLRLVTSIFKAAHSRLATLTEMENFCKATGVSSVVIGCEAAELPPVEVLRAQKTNLVTFDDFLRMLNGKPISVASETEPTGEQRIPNVLAERLVALVQGQDLQVCHDFRQQQFYSDFLKAVGSEITDSGLSQERSALPLSPGNRPFHTSAFKFVLSQFEAWGMKQVHTRGKMGLWGSNWTVDGVLEVLKDFEKAQAVRQKEKIQMKEDAAELLGPTLPHSVVPVHDLYALAVALL